MSEEPQQRTESLRKMVETRDLIIKDLEREIRELKAMLHGTTFDKSRALFTLRRMNENAQALGRLAKGKPKTHKGAPLMDAIDEYATTDKARIAASRVDLWRRVKMHMAVKLRVEEKDITDKDLAYFVRRMGVSYLIRKIHSMTTVTAEHMLLWANTVEAQ